MCLLEDMPVVRPSARRSRLRADSSMITRARQKATSFRVLRFV